MLSTAAIALRLLARRVTKARLWWDDWMALSTYVSLITDRRETLQPRRGRTSAIDQLGRAAGMGSWKQCLWHQVYVKSRQASNIYLPR